MSSENQNQETQAGSGFLFVGNCLCLDFVNTEKISDGARVDLLRDTSALAAWLKELAIFPDSFSLKGREAEALAEARTLRASLRKMMEQIAAGSEISSDTLAAVNRVLAHRQNYSQITHHTGNVFTKQIVAPYTEPLHLLAPIAEDAAELLFHGDLSLIRKCENPQCILFFYDTTKNHARRWCSMGACGNRAKAAAHYKRHKQSGSGAGVE
jgi:predicted RNA-binding Zn ribbon-like protein